jgi:hypothetical protein
MKTPANIRAIIVLALSAVAALHAQSLTGTVTAADTGAPLAQASVVAVLRSGTPGQTPSIYESVTGSSGNYAISAPPGQYAMCVHTLPQSLYMDPCLWGSPVAVTVGASAAAVVPLSLQKGVRFLVRVHDPNQFLPQAESVTGTAVSASVSSASVPQCPLPMVYSDGIVRDYGTVVPINVPLSVAVSSRNVALAGSGGTAVPTSPMPFKVLPTDIEVTGAPLSSATRMFPPPDAKIIHVYATGLK